MAFEDVEEYRSSGLDDRDWYLVQNSNSSLDLYGELQNTAERFKKLADKLQKNATRKDKKNDKGIQTYGCCEETKTKLMECIAENLRLRQSLKDVSDINHRWQDYNHDRQKHVQHLLSTVSELRRTVDDMRQQTRKPSSEENEKSEAENFTKQESCRKPPKESEMVELNNRSTSLINKLTHEVRVLSRQLKDARNESKSLTKQLGKVVEENDILKNLLKSYKSDWKDENKKKIEALSQAQQVVQELCALKVNCQLQAERLMEMSTVSFNCSLCQGTENTHTLNNLNVDSESEDCVTVEHSKRHKRLIQTANTIIQSIDGIEVHLQERCSGEAIRKKRTDHKSSEGTHVKKPFDSAMPIVTFPDSDSDEQTTITEEPCVQLLTQSQCLMCPVCNESFLKEHGLQFFEHYTKCKLITPVS